MSTMNREPISEQKLLSKHIKPHHHVLCVGPGHNTHDDPSALHICTRIKQRKGGKVTLLDTKFNTYTIVKTRKPWAAYDPQAKTWPHPLYKALLRHATPEEIEKTMDETGVRQGDPYSYRKQVREFSKEHKKAAIIPKVWIATAVDNKMPSESVDRIVDRSANLWILGLPATPGYNERLKMLASEYARVTKLGGKIIVMFHPRQQRTTASDDMKEALEAVGLKVTEHPLKLEDYKIARKTTRKNPQWWPYLALVARKSRPPQKIRPNRKQGA